MVYFCYVLSFDNLIYFVYKFRKKFFEKSVRLWFRSCLYRCKGKNQKGGLSMNDKDIIQLYLNRDQRALSATAKKYGKYCTSIAKNILGNNEDAEEDTPANRTAICKELGRSESNTTFVKGTYTLAYLTELQEKITNAMVNKEIPFVVTSGVYETTNNIIIRVTTNDEAELAKVYALDTIGGAIKVEFSAGAVVEELLLPLPKAE